MDWYHWIGLGMLLIFLGVIVSALIVTMSIRKKEKLLKEIRNRFYDEWITR